MHNRATERAALKRKLVAGVSIHMPAPRRIGKTWLLARLAEDLRADNWLVVEVDVEGMRTTAAFASELCRRIEASCPTRVGFTANFRARIKQVIGGDWNGSFTDALGRLDPLEFTDELIATISDRTDAVVLIDEIAYFVLECAASDPEATHELHPPESYPPALPKSPRLLTGSIGLDVVARRHGLEGALADLELFPLGPFTTEEARSFMCDAAIVARFTHPFTASDDDLNWMFKEMGWLSPFYLDLVANQVRPSVAPSDGQPPTATRADFEAAFAALLAPGRQSHFAVFREHIKKNLPPADAEIAWAMLDALSERARRRDRGHSHGGWHRIMNRRPHQDN